MLVGTLLVPDEFGIPVKMSKSLGNFYTIKDALKLHRPEVIRTFILTSHYRNPIVFSEDALDSARKGWERIYGAVRLTREKLRQAAGTATRATLSWTCWTTRKQQFIEAMDDDFNAPGGLAVLHELTREVNTLLNSDQAGRQGGAGSHRPDLPRAGRRRCWASCRTKPQRQARPTPNAKTG